jgi:prevent-host-death family protein
MGSLYRKAENLQTGVLKAFGSIAFIESPCVLHYCSTMKTATVRDLRNHYSQLLAWVSAGEEITITQRGKPVARLMPAPAPSTMDTVDWSQSPAVLRDRSGETCMSAEDSSKLLKEAAGQW